MGLEMGIQMASEIGIQMGIEMGMGQHERLQWQKRESVCELCSSYLEFPNSPPNRPPPLVPPPLFLASFRIHSFINSASLIVFTSTNFVCVWASPPSKESSVGMEVIIYLIPNPLPIMSCASYSISQKDTPPSNSPTPDSSNEVRIGDTVRQVLQ